MEIKRGSKIDVLKTSRYGYQMKGIYVYFQEMYFFLGMLAPKARGKGSKGVKMDTLITLVSLQGQSRTPNVGVL